MTIKEAIQNTLTEIKRVDIAKKRMVKLLDQVDRGQNELAQLGKILENEYKDVERLEKANLRSLFSQILGTRETQLEAERQEYLRAALHYKERKRTIDLMLKEQDLLMVKINRENELHQHLKNLIEKRSSELKLTNSQAKNEIKAVQLAMDEQFSMMREIHEAQIVGAKVRKLLGQMTAHLAKAKEWGFSFEQESIFGTNPMIRLNRRQEVDAAHQMAYEVKLALELYQMELLDIYDQQKISMHFNLDQFDQFIEEHFNNLITDWLIQKRIFHALHYALALGDRVLKIQQSLKASIVKSEQSIRYMEEKKEKIVLSFS